MKNKNLLHVLEHPLLQHYLSQLRNHETKPSDFRKLMSEIGRILGYEMTRDLNLKSQEIVTPMEKTRGKVIAEDVVIVSILRSGNALVDGLIQVLPFAMIGHIGIYRDRFIKNTVEYYFKIPKNIKNKRIILADPLIASGDTAIAAINRLKDCDVGDISLASILISPMAAERIKSKSADVKIYCLSQERELNSEGYLLPGLGDAGDRLYGVH